MKIEFINKDGKKYVYNESPWTGKKDLFVDGNVAKKLTKKQFQLTDNIIATIKGNFVSGVKLELSNGDKIVMCQNEWFEWLLIFLPILNLGLGIFCGAIGGGLSGLFGVLAMYLNTLIVRSELNIAVKAIVSIIIFCISFFAWFMIYAAIVGGLTTAFPAIFS